MNQLPMIDEEIGDRCRRAWTWMELMGGNSNYVKEERGQTGSQISNRH